jgi:hypothetical protein
MEDRNEGMDDSALLFNRAYKSVFSHGTRAAFPLDPE